MNRTKGFTLLDLMVGMVVISIIGIFIVILSKSLHEAQKRNHAEIVMKELNKKAPEAKQLEGVKLKELSPEPKKLKKEVETDIYGDPINKKRSLSEKGVSKETLRNMLLTLVTVAALTSIVAGIAILKVQYDINVFKWIVDNFFREKPEE
jgi:competence protein ComGF